MSRLGQKIYIWDNLFLFAIQNGSSNYNWYTTNISEEYSHTVKPLGIHWNPNID